MAKDADQKAHDKGEQDSNRSRGRNDFVDIITDQIFGGSYNPTKGHEDSYKQGWDNDQKQKNSHWAHSILLGCIKKSLQRNTI